MFELGGAGHTLTERLHGTNRQGHQCWRLFKSHVQSSMRAHAYKHTHAHAHRHACKDMYKERKVLDPYIKIKIIKIGRKCCELLIALFFSKPDFHNLSKNDCLEICVAGADKLHPPTHTHNCTLTKTDLNRQLYISKVSLNSIVYDRLNKSSQTLQQSSARRVSSYS